LGLRPKQNFLRHGVKRYEGEPMNDLIDKIAPLEQNRHLIGEVPVDAALAALRREHGAAAVDAALAAVRRRAEGHAWQNARQRIEASNGGKVEHSSQLYVEGDYHVNPPPADPAEARRQRALVTYLSDTRSLCDVLPLTSLDATDATSRPIALSSVYVEMDVTARGSVLDRFINVLGGDKQPERLTAVQVLGGRAGDDLAAALDPSRRIMLLGAPGSGKSTFVSHLALCLAGACLAEQLPHVPQPDGGWLSRLPGWDRGSLLPIKVVLRDFAAFAPLADAPRGSLKLLHDFLRSVLAEADCAEAFDALLTALGVGKAILLFDGLDEVVGSPILERVVESISAAARAYPQSPILTTCRVLDYESERRRQIAGFATHTLAELSNAQIERFIDSWYAELAASGRRSAPQAREDTQILTQAVNTRGELRDLARLPLLLTVMALVHTNKGTLPDARALLYLECIELLLLRWRQPRGERDLLARLGLSEFRSSDLLAMMARLGFAAHEAAERDETSQGQPADLSEAAVTQILADSFAQYDPGRKLALAEIVMGALTQGNGLLLQRGPGVYSFPHRTFQEFLAGYHLLRQKEYLKSCLERTPYPHWHEALLLMAGYQVLAGGELEKPLSLAERLLRQSPNEQLLAAELLLLIGRERAATYDRGLLARGGLWPRVRATLHQLAFSPATTAPPALRARAGNLIGSLCYGRVETLTAPDVSIPMPDPRLPLAVVGLPGAGTPAWKRAFAAYWCPIAPGPFWYGDEEADNSDSDTLVARVGSLAKGAVQSVRGQRGSLRQVELPYHYQIARYLTTNADYARFIADGGYEREECWTEEGWKYLQPDGERGFSDPQGEITMPRLWRNSRYNSPIQPVVGVSWYEAAAYCIWLTTQGHEQGWLPMEEELRLPTSLEWERVARHIDQRRYPWGDTESTSEQANFAATKIGAPSTVGCFPQGAAVCGALDIAGNVWEWTATPYGQDEQRASEKDFTPRQGVVLRGGDYSENIGRLRCGSRSRSIPYGGDDNLGFRVLRSLVLIK
jgi:formylglycine-generating enzyme required for sulfatase activity